MGEWVDDDMIKYKNGNILKWPWSIQDRVSYCMDTEISTPYPKSWHKRIFNQTFSEDNKNHAEILYNI